MTEEKKTVEQAYAILERINSPSDLKDLDEQEVKALAGEIRAFLVESVTETGGHLASNLGVVELTLAIHRVFSTPHDHLIFDVGHQSYVHKLITGRKGGFATLRRGGGLSGFPKISESEHDCFGTGHSSTSLSAALGFAEADKLSGSDAYTICVLGDGAYTGGMIHEALNNCRKKLRLIIIINENEMSISKNIGRFAKSLSRLRTSGGYYRTKNDLTSILHHIPLIGKPIFRFLRKIKYMVKSALYGSNYFENLGLEYLGPIDGSDEETLERVLTEAKNNRHSCVIHVKTQKGRGYAPAEASPDKYHGMAPASKPIPDGPNFSQEMGARLCAIAGRNDKICAITAAMTLGTGLDKFRGAHPARFFDVGIAEEHAVTFAAGLAASGMRPVVCIYSTFLQRAYDNIIHDVALQQLPVTFCIDRAGLNASDGATHHGLFDVAFLSQIPGMELYTPATYEALHEALELAVRASGPVAIRYPSGWEREDIKAAFYGAGSRGEETVRVCDIGAPDCVIVTHGRIASEALKAARTLEADGRGCRVILLEKLAPYAQTAKLVGKWIPKAAKTVLFLEEEIRQGGFGMMLSDAMADMEIMKDKRTVILGTDQSFAVQERDEPIWKTAGVDAESILKILKQ